MTPTASSPCILAATSPPRGWRSPQDAPAWHKLHQQAYRSFGLDWVHPDKTVNHDNPDHNASSEWWKVLSPQERDIIHFLDLTQALLPETGSSEEVVDLRPNPNYCRELCKSVCFVQESSRVFSCCGA